MTVVVALAALGATATLPFVQSGSWWLLIPGGAGLFLAGAGIVLGSGRPLPWAAVALCLGEAVALLIQGGPPSLWAAPFALLLFIGLEASHVAVERPASRPVVAPVRELVPVYVAAVAVVLTLAAATQFRQGGLLLAVLGIAAAATLLAVLGRLLLYTGEPRR